MKNLKHISLVHTLVVLITLTLGWGCSDENDSPFVGTDTHFLSLKLTATNGEVYEAAIADNEMTLYVPSNVSLENAKAEYELCEQVTIHPDPNSITDWNTEQVFRLIAYNGEVEVYTLKIVRENVYSAGSVTLTTQSEVTAFAEQGINVIEGNLIIGATSIVDDPIITLSPLKELSRIKGAVIIRDTYTGNSLAGLENLREVGAIMIGTQESSIDIATMMSIDMPVLEKAGDIIMNSNCVQTLNLPTLKRISRLYMNSKSLQTIDLPVLETCTGDMELGTSSNKNDNLEHLLCPQLKQVGGKLVVQYMSELKTIDLSSLQEVSGNLSFVNLTVVEALEAPELTHVGGALEIKNTYTPSRIYFPKLAIVNTFNIAATNNNCEAEVFDFSSLSEVSGAFTLSMKGNNLSTLSLPKLSVIGGAATISDLTAITELSMPELSTVGNLTVKSLLELRELSLPRLVTMGNLTVQTTAVTIVSALQKISLPALTTSGTITLTMLSNLEELAAPSLTECKGISLTTLSSMQEFRFPESFNESFPGTLTVSNCAKLNRIYGPAEYVGNVRLSLSKEENSSIPEFTSANALPINLKEGFTLGNNSRSGDIAIKGIRSVAGTLTISPSVNYGTTLSPFTVEFSDLEEIGSLSLSDYNGLVGALKAPKLTLATGNVSISQAQAVQAIQFPMLTEIQGNLSISGTRWYPISKLTNLDGFGSLQSLGGNLSITYCTSLVDYSGLKQLIPTLDFSKCNISNNAYNPTLEDIMAGRLVQE